MQDSNNSARGHIAARKLKCYGIVRCSGVCAFVCVCVHVRIHHRIFLLQGQREGLVNGPTLKPLLNIVSGCSYVR